MIWRISLWRHSWRNTVSQENIYSLPSFFQNIKEIQIQHNIYNLNEWVIFKKFSKDNIYFYSYKIPDFKEITDKLIKVDNKKYKVL